MSYRVYVCSDIDERKYQCLGNNEFPEILRKTLNKQGAKIYPSKDCIFNMFEIKDLQSVIEALEQYIIDQDNWYVKNNYGSIADYKSEFDIAKQRNLTYKISNWVECGYIFVTYNFLKAIEGCYEEDWNIESKRMIYKIKEGRHIYMSGF